MVKEGLIAELNDLKQEIVNLKKENKELSTRPAWFNQKVYKRNIAKLKRKIESLEKHNERFREQLSKYYDVHSYINDCESRMMDNKYSFTNESVREIIHVLTRILP